MDPACIRDLPCLPRADIGYGVLNEMWVFRYKGTKEACFLVYVHIQVFEQILVIATGVLTTALQVGSVHVGIGHSKLVCRKSVG